MVAIILPRLDPEDPKRWGQAVDNPGTVSLPKMQFAKRRAMAVERHVSEGYRAARAAGFTPDVSQKVGCDTRLPNGKTVGDYVRQYRPKLQSSMDLAVDASGYGLEADPLSAATGTFARIARDNGPIDFKNQFRGGDKATLGRAGDFAYYAIGSGILPDAELDAGAGAYALTAALRGQKPFSSLTGRMFSDASAHAVRDDALAANGCRR